MDLCDLIIFYCAAYKQRQVHKRGAQGGSKWSRSTADFGAMFLQQHHEGESSSVWTHQRASLRTKPSKV